MSEYDSQLGKSVLDWSSAQKPTSEIIEGQVCRLEPLVQEHAQDLWESCQLDADQRNFTYLSYGPFESVEAYQAWIQSVSRNIDQLLYAVIDKRTQLAVGVAGYVDILPEIGSIEIGSLNFSPRMQRSIMSSETVIMMAKNAFRLGYRSLVWRCNSLNEASLTAAKRYGFRCEALFKNYAVMKGRNRNTAWLCITAEEWPEVNRIYDEWLEKALAGNHQSLSKMTKHLSDSYLPTKEPIWTAMPANQNRLKNFPILDQDIHFNDIGLPLGQPVEGWKNPDTIPMSTILGKRCILEELDQGHAGDLWKLLSADDQGNVWQFKSYGPFISQASLEAWIDQISAEAGVFAILDKATGRCIGTLGLVSSNPEFGSIRLGHLNVLDQDSPILREAVGLLADLVFNSGYRRLEWTCNKLDLESTDLAKKFGFSYEGVFRNYGVVKGRNRDLAWLSITRDELNNL